MPPLQTRSPNPSSAAAPDRSGGFRALDGSARIREFAYDDEDFAANVAKADKYWPGLVDKHGK